MANKCIPCMGENIKKELLEHFDVAEQLEEVETCPIGTLMMLCTPGAKSHDGRGKSEYQVFISECLKAEHKEGEPITGTMKQCAVQWKAKKELAEHE